MKSNKRLPKSLSGYWPLVYAVVFIAIILMAVSVRGQENRTVVIRDFSGGMMTRVSEAVELPKHADIFFNLDPWRFEPALGRRQGFVRADSADSQPSTNRVGVYGFTNISYDRILFQTVLNDSNWQDLYTSDMDNDSGYWLSPDIDAFKRRWVYQNTTPDWSSHNNVVFLSDQINYPVAIDARGTGDSAARPAVSLYLPPPGAPLLEIIDSAGLTGQFRYAIATWPPRDTTIVVTMDTISGWIGYISPVITLNNQSVVIHCFPAMVWDSANAGVEENYAKFRILRTKADRVDPLVDSLYFLGDTLTYGSMDSIDAIYVIDDGTTPTFVPDSHLAMTTDFIYETTQDSARPQSMTFRYRGTGQPLYQQWGQGTGLEIHNSETYSAGIRHLGATSDSSSVFYAHYFCTYYDTLLEMESDSGKNLVIAVDTTEYDGTTEEFFHINFPRIPNHPQYKNCVLNIYRAARFDTTSTVDNHYVFFKEFQRIARMTGRAGVARTDNVRISDMEVDLEKYPYWEGSPAPPHRFKGIEFYDDRGYAWYDNRVWVTDPDSLRFSELGFVAVNPELGDEIITIVPAEDRIIIYTTRERHEIYEDDWGDLTLVSPPEISRGIGCINPHVMQSWRGSRIYLSADGRVYMESHVSGRDRGSRTDQISRALDNILTNYSYDELKAATSAIVDDDKYFLSFPDKDTVFVCFLEVKDFPWGIQGLSFLQSTFYKNHSSLFKGATGELVFTSGQDQKLYRWGGVDDDSVDVAESQWRSLPFGMEANPYPIDGYAIFTAGMATDSSDSIEITFLNDKKTVVYTDTVVTSTVYGTKYYPMGGLSYSNWWQVEIDFFATGSDSMRVVRIDIYKGYPEALEGGE